jgi:hypothetical protein
LTQGTLALSFGKQIITYSMVVEKRQELWEQRGFKLLSELRENLEDFCSGQDRLDALVTLARINHLIVEIGALDPRWLGFSTYVFALLLDYNPLKKSVHAKRLHQRFSEALETLYVR